MKHYNDFIKLLKEIGRNAYVDWVTILLLSIIMAAGLAIGGWYLYNAILAGNFQGGSDTPSTIPVPKYNTKAISAVMTDFEKKEAQIKWVKEKYSVVGDPSLPR